MDDKYNHTALITGASRGLGLALARALAQKGWRLIIDARDARALEASRSELARFTQITAISGDISDSEHRAELVKAAEKIGKLDVVVNNASILGSSPQHRLLDYPIHLLKQVFNVNVFAPIGLIQEIHHTFTPSAVIINITSDAAIEAYDGWGGYGSSKAALEQLSAVLAVEYPQWHIYWVDPGDMRTQMQQQAFPGEDISDRPLPEISVPGLLALLEGQLPSGRYHARKVVEITDTVA